VTASSSQGPKPTPRPPATTTAAVAAPAASTVATADGKHVAEPSMGQLVSDATTALSTLIHSEIELAKLELKSSVRVGIASVAAFIAAAILLLFGLIYGFQAIAEAIALALPRWAAFLIVFGAFVVLAVLLVIFGVKRIKRVAAPKQTIKTTRETVDYLKKSRN
jgi:uncharacterized membrane protein YqjE